MCIMNNQCIKYYGQRLFFLQQYVGDEELEDKQRLKDC